MLVSRQPEHVITSPKGPPPAQVHTVGATLQLSSRTVVLPCQNFSVSPMQVWTASDFPSAPPEGCGLTQEQYQDLVHCRLGTPVAEPWGEEKNLAVSEWKQYILDLYVMN